MATRKPVVLAPNSIELATGDTLYTGWLPEPQGRLTLAPGLPVITAAVSGAASVIYTPYLGNLVPLWNGSVFVPTVFAEVSQALSDATKSPAAAVAGAVYDLFGWLDGATVRVTRGPAWTAGATAGSNTARGSGAGSTALTRVNGLQTNQYAITNGPAAGYGTYLGTVATDASAATASWSMGGASAGGTAGVVNLWNRYNPVPFAAQIRDSTSNWTYTSAAWRAADGSTGNRVTFVTGDASAAYVASYNCVLQNSNSAAAGYIGVGVDAVNSPTGSTGLYQTFAANALGSASAKGAATGLLGQHFISAIEYGSAGQVFFGVNAPVQSAVLIVTGSY